MEVKPIKICRASNVELGSLFVMFGGVKGNPICLRAAYDMPEDEDEANRIIPIHWPEDPASVGVTVYASKMNGYAVVLEDACLEVDLLSAHSVELDSLSAVYGKDDRLYFPISYDGRFQGLVDAQSGEILSRTSGSYIDFGKWQITIGPKTDRLVLLPTPK